MLAEQSIWTIRGLTNAQRYELFSQRPVAADDIAILQRADEILSADAVWNRADSRICDRSASSWSLFCALKEASIQIAGKYDNRRVAMEEIRFIVYEVATLDRTRPNPHPLMDYNNLPTTRFEDIKNLLRIARERLIARVAR